VGVRDIMTNSRNGCRKCLLEREFSNGHHSDSRTYVQDPKDLFEARPPTGNRLFISPRAETPRDRIPFTPLDQVLMYFCHCPEIEMILYQWAVRNACRWLYSQRQLIYRIIHGLAGLIWFLSFYLPVKRSTDIGAG
jgi:hypothetical protein